MNHVKFTVEITEINQLDSDTIYGICRFRFKRNTRIIESNLAFRAKGTPALTIQKKRENVTGMATGYLTITTKFTNRGYKEIKAILVIRNFVINGTSTIDSKNLDDSELLPQKAEKIVSTSLEDNAESNGYAKRPAETFKF